MTETYEEAEKARKGARHSTKQKEQEVRDFVPYKVAIRLRDTISFSTRLDGRDDLLLLGKKSLSELKKRDG